MAQVPQQTFEGGFVRNNAAGNSTLYGASVDGTSGWGLAGGIGYAYDTNWGLGAPARQGSDLRGGVALGVNSEAGRVMIGGSIRHLAVDTFAGSTVTPLTKRSLALWTGDLGIDLALQSVRLGVVLRNGLSPDAAEAPRRIAFGIGYLDPHLLAEADASFGAQNPTAAAGTSAASGQMYRVGAGYLFGDEGLHLRAGYVFDQSEVGHAVRHFVGGGLGWHGARLGLDASVQVNAAQADEWIVGVGLTWVVPFDAGQ